MSACQVGTSIGCGFDKNPIGKVVFMLNVSDSMTADRLPGSIPLCRQELGNQQAQYKRLDVRYLCNLIRLEIRRKTNNNPHVICLY